MQELSVKLTTRFAPPIEDVAEKLKETLSGANNPGELVSELHRQIGEHKLVLLVFLRPYLVVRGHSTLTILLTEEENVTTAELVGVHITAYTMGDSGYRGFLKSAEYALRELGFSGENDAEQEEQEKNGLLSAVKAWWRKDEL